MEEAIKNWLLGCPHIKQNKTFYNFLKGENNNQGIQMLLSNQEDEDIIGNKFGTISVSISQFKTIKIEALAYNDENIKDYQEVQKINSWIIEQEKLKKYPIIEDCFIEKINISPNPMVDGMNNNLVKYSINFTISYNK